FGRFPHSQGRLKKGDWEKVNQAIDYMELDPIKDKYLDELSGGQRQRAYIAMVLAQDNDYNIIYEPLNTLDMSISSKYMNNIRKNKIKFTQITVKQIRYTQLIKN